jgi:hypothetical protein
MTDGTTETTDERGVAAPDATPAEAPAEEVAPPGHRAGGGALKGLIGMGVFLVAVLAIGAVLGFGPLAAPTPPAQVTDPREMIARGLQAILDSASVHVDGTVAGTIPGALVGQGTEPVVLDGMTVAADALPKDATTTTHVEIPALDVALDTTSVWDVLWYRTQPDEPWLRASVGGVAADAGVDVNPLTLVDRLRAYLNRPDIVPSATDAPCPDGSGTCRHIVLDAGSDPVTLLKVMLPDDTEAAIPPVSTTVTVDSQVQTLRPVRVAVDMVSDDGAIDVHLVLEPSRWDDPSITIEPPAPGS